MYVIVDVREREREGGEERERLLESIKQWHILESKVSKQKKNTGIFQDA